MSTYEAALARFIVVGVMPWAKPCLQWLSQFLEGQRSRGH